MASRDTIIRDMIDRVIHAANRDGDSSFYHRIVFKDIVYGPVDVVVVCNDVMYVIADIDRDTSKPRKVEPSTDRCMTCIAKMCMHQKCVSKSVVNRLGSGSFDVAVGEVVTTTVNELYAEPVIRKEEG